jgi:hypothetical protein
MKSAEMTGHPADAGGDHGRRVGVIDARDGANGNAAGKARSESDTGEPVHAQRRLGVVLAQGGEDAADAGVIHGEAIELVGLLDVLERQPDDRLCPEQPSRIGRMHIALAEMHAVGSRGERHVDPIVDEERHTGAVERRLERPGGRDETTTIAMLVAVLIRVQPPSAAARASAGRSRPRVRSGSMIP